MMGRRGPRPEPTALKVLKGNPGGRPINDSEPKPQPVAPKCPRWLSKEAKREWRRLVKELEPLGLLTVVDGIALATLCEEWATYAQAQRTLTERGHTYEYVNKAGEANIIARPEVGIANKSFMAIKAMCAEFGLTPSARSRMRVKLPEAEKDEYEEYRKRGQASRKG